MVCLLLTCSLFLSTRQVTGRPTLRGVNQVPSLSLDLADPPGGQAKLRYLPRTHKLCSQCFSSHMWKIVCVRVAYTCACVRALERNQNRESARFFPFLQLEIFVLKHWSLKTFINCCLVEGTLSMC